MSLGLLISLSVPGWAVLAGLASLAAEKHGLSPRIWYVASLLSGPISWVVLYLKVRDRRERVGPGKKRSGNLRDLTLKAQRKRGFTIR